MLAGALGVPQKYISRHPMQPAPKRIAGAVAMEADQFCDNDVKNILNHIVGVGFRHATVCGLGSNQRTVQVREPFPGIGFG